MRRLIPNAPRGSRRDAILLPACFAVLGLCLFWIYAFATQPYLGLSFGPGDWIVDSPPDQCRDSPAACPQSGDQILSIGSVDRETFLEDRTVFAFRDVPEDP
ncbi:MAG: hypothetical protein AAFX50_18730, partial [Acidobacteriota bacterium]